MSVTSFDTVREQVKALSQAEQRQLLSLLETMLSARQEPLTEEAFEKELLREGILDQVPQPFRDDVAFQEFKPVDVQGKPISETIIEERR